MAEVKNVSLQIGPLSNGKRNVSVTYTLAFDPVEAGDQYKLSINLLGSDPIGDEEGVFSFLGPQVIYTFTFGSFPFKRKYKTVTAVAGEQTYTDSQLVSSQTLNEDPGVDYIEIDINTVVPIPHPDEVFASVSVAREASSAPVTLVA